MKTGREVVNAPPIERAALIGVSTRATRERDPDISLDELDGLARAAGAEVVFRDWQDRPSPDPATLVGKGKAQSIGAKCAELGVDLVIVDHELTPAQARNLEEAVGRRVIDRTELILDIFARRARTREGQLQVELAQLQYRLPRLTGANTALSRLGGGIGTRGPGETKLEVDRRRIRHRISVIDREMSHVKRRRGYLRTRRRRTDTATVALVGYTNAGKTTLFNQLTGDSAEASDALFVTLDPIVRRMRLAPRQHALVSDTVGFIDRLPHQLVAAFHGTLEEVAGADLLLHVIDAAAPDRDRRRDAVLRVLTEIGAERVPVVDVYNKTDQLDPDARRHLSAAHPGAVMVSARTGAGMTDLVETMASRLDVEAERVRLDLDGRRDADKRLVADLYRHGRVLSHVAAGHRVQIEADVPRRLLARFARGRVPA